MPVGSRSTFGVTTTVTGDRDSARDRKSPGPLEQGQGCCWSFEPEDDSKPAAFASMQELAAEHSQHQTEQRTQTAEAEVSILSSQ